MQQRGYINPMVHGGVPSSWKYEISPAQKFSLRLKGIMAAVSATSTQTDRYNGSKAACSQRKASCTDSIVIRWGPRDSKIYNGKDTVHVFPGTLIVSVSTLLAAKFLIDIWSSKGGVPSSKICPSVDIASRGTNASCKQYDKRLLFLNRAVGRPNTCCSNNKRWDLGMKSSLCFVNG